MSLQASFGARSSCRFSDSTVFDSDNLIVDDKLFLASTVDATHDEQGRQDDNDKDKHSEDADDDALVIS